MAYYIVASGGVLYKVDTSGNTRALTLPADTTLSATRPARMAILGKNVVVVNGPTRSMWVDTLDVVRPMVLRPPTSPLILAAGATGTYSGTVLAKYTHIIKNAQGAVISESDFSPVSLPLTTLLKLIQVSGVQKSPDPSVTHHRIYRTTTGPGSVFYYWFDIDGNATTAGSSQTSDAGLAINAAPTGLGAAPGTSPGTFMSVIVAWKGRLWGVGDVDVDYLRFSELTSIYGWPSSYTLPVAPIGFDSYGITGLLPRRDELGIAKRNVLWKVTGSSPSDFQMIKVIEGKGCYAPDSIVMIRDIGYFLGEDGVYSWGPEGVTCISDEKVRTWFASDVYFNRALYPSAFGKYNSRYHTYELHLAGSGSSAIDRWVSYDIARKAWFGPHKTDAFSPSAGAQIIDINNLTTPVIGAIDGFLYTQNHVEKRDVTWPIGIDFGSKFHAGNTPDIHKLFGDISLLSKVTPTKGNMEIAVRVGELEAPVAFTLRPDMREGRERFRTIGPGRFCQFEITENTIDQDVEIYGYELPFHEIGRR